jgi:hydroxypyruvate isomerase
VPGIGIEPLTPYDAPGYFPSNSHTGDITAELGAANLKPMFDCYHVPLIEGEITHRLERHLPFLGLIQFASGSDRSMPDQSEIDDGYIIDLIDALGWDHPLGTEYRQQTSTGDKPDWFCSLR